MENSLTKAIESSLEERDRHEAFLSLPTNEKVELIKRKYNLTHGKGKRKRKKK